ncbi:hypothetical protein TY87_09175 [Marinomonas sp. BSi20584]|nr:hypothetical protein TY87_09175 [Marinomonas sp. BSi20584]
MTPASGYLTSAQLCERLGNLSTRTLHRWQQKEINPLPEPTIRPSGTCNLWSADEIYAWEEREKALSKARSKKASTH